MPQLITHNLFGDDVFQKLDKNIQNTFADEKMLMRCFVKVLIIFCIILVSTSKKQKD